MEKLGDGFRNSWNCPLTQSLPYIILSSERIRERLGSHGTKMIKLLRPVMRAGRGRICQEKILREVAHETGIHSDDRIERAIRTGFEALDAFNAWQKRRGEEVLSQLAPGDRAIVIIGRAYNTYDDAMTLNIPEKLRDCLLYT
ncbi:MAG: acyl-CoA dehydratase activase-related protein, partial [Dehalococcoidales bacterium]|nr:acyl-CoA dehydratase activase-related protein [Dehalococcoidales bacterium]